MMVEEQLRGERVRQQRAALTKAGDASVRVGASRRGQAVGGARCVEGAQLDAGTDVCGTGDRVHLQLRQAGQIQHQRVGAAGVDAVAPRRNAHGSPASYCPAHDARYLSDIRWPGNGGGPAHDIVVPSGFCSVVFCVRRENYRWANRPQLGNVTRKRLGHRPS